MMLQAKFVLPFDVAVCSTQYTYALAMYMAVFEHHNDTKLTMSEARPSTKLWCLSKGEHKPYINIDQQLHVYDGQAW